jgi:hypothetical protein
VLEISGGQWRICDRIQRLAHVGAGGQGEDMFTYLRMHHNWTYQALAYMMCWRAEEEEKVTSWTKRKVYKGNPFPQVVQAIQEAFEQIKKGRRK